MTSWKPGRLHERLKLEEPFEGVPPHMLGPVVAWIEQYTENDPTWVAYLCNQLRQPLNGNPLLDEYEFAAAKHRLGRRLRASADFLLEAAEAVLEANHPSDRATELESILRFGHSATT